MNLSLRSAGEGISERCSSSEGTTLREGKARRARHQLLDEITLHEAAEENSLNIYLVLLHQSLQVVQSLLLELSLRVGQTGEVDLLSSEVPLS